MATDTKDDEYAEMRIVTVIVRLGWGGSECGNNTFERTRDAD